MLVDAPCLFSMVCTWLRFESVLHDLDFWCEWPIFPLNKFFLALEVDNWRKEIHFQRIYLLQESRYCRGCGSFQCFPLARLQTCSWLGGLWSRRGCKAADVQLRAGVTESLEDKSFLGIFWNKDESTTQGIKAGGTRRGTRNYSVNLALRMNETCSTLVIAV